MRNPLYIHILCLGLLPAAVYGQSAATATAADSLQKAVSDIATLKKVKISGYMQPQFQVADTHGISSYAGGSFSPNSDSRFKLRRARIKAAYGGKQTNFVFQFDVTESGLAIKDVYASFTEPWMNAVSVTAGMMNRPFGFEVGYSSCKRESPERGRMSQIIFAGERDLGAKMTIAAPENCALTGLELNAGLFNGNGAASAGSGNTDWDEKKDFIGQVTYGKKAAGEKFEFRVGASYYDGGLAQSNKYVWSFGDQAGTPFMLPDSAENNQFSIGKRDRLGADGQVGIESPIGKITLRGEYIEGTQPGTSSSSTSPKSDPVSDYGADLNVNKKLDTYRRMFNGAYFYFVWDILKSKHQLVFKYDWYDPNTDVAGDAIESDHGFTSADIKYSTMGFGWTYHWDKNVKMVAYYDLVTNETSSNLAGYSKDKKDNVFTFRLQYSF